MLQSHGKVEECIYQAEQTDSNKQLIIHFINKKEYVKALSKLELISDKKIRNEQMMIYASIFLREAPNETLKSLRSA